MPVPKVADDRRALAIARREPVDVHLGSATVANLLHPSAARLLAHL
jgi:hypothetical protein